LILNDIMDISIGHDRSAQLTSSRESDGLGLNATRNPSMTRFRCSISRMFRGQSVAKQWSRRI
jgi:hypothetical protein